MTSQRPLRGPDILDILFGFVQEDIDKGLIPCADWNRTFSFTRVAVRDSNHLKTIRAEVDQIGLSKRIFCGPVPKAEPWQTIFNSIEAWILSHESETNDQSRRWVVVALQKERVFQIREFFKKTGGVPSIRLLRLLLHETTALREISVRYDGVTHDSIILRHSVFQDLITLSFVDPMGEPQVTDAELKDAQNEGEALCHEYQISGNYYNQYRTMMQLARIAAQRNQRLKTISLKETLDYTERAEELFNEMRRQQTVFQGMPITDKIQLYEDVDHGAMYDHALFFSLEQYNQATQRSVQVDLTDAERNEAGRTRIQRYEEFLTWTHRSKARSLLEALGLRDKIPRYLFDEAQRDPKTAQLLAEERSLILQIVDADDRPNVAIQEALHRKRDQLRADRLAKPIMDIRDGTLPSISQLQRMSRELGQDVVIVDYVHIGIQESPEIKMAIKMIVYRNGTTHDRIPIFGINMTDVEAWTKRNLHGNDAMLAAEEESPKQLEELAKLVEPLARFYDKDGWQGLKAGETLTKPGDTVVFCPTKFLHQIPLHALPLLGGPLIERNPVVYCQSLPTLRTNIELYKDRRNEPVRTPITTIVHALPPDADSRVPVEQLAASLLHTEFHRGVDLLASDVLTNLNGSTTFYYHGHVEFEPRNAMSSRLALAHERPPDVPTVDGLAPSSKPPSRAITAHEIWSLNLAHPPFHTHLLGCRSGLSQHLGADDLLGFPTAFLGFGATSVVSALWRILDADGARFSAAFWGSLRRQKEELEDGAEKDLDLAVALREAVLEMRRPTAGVEEKRVAAPYHWAGFVLHGYWKIPAWCVEFVED